MKHLKPLTFAAAVFILVLLGAGLAALFHLRFEQGDIYPTYSSLRSDPLGTRAFYESLERLDGVQVERDYRSLEELETGKSTALFLLGGTAGNLYWNPEETFNRLHLFMRTGGRMIAAFTPRSGMLQRTVDSIEERQRRDSEEKDEEKDEEEDEAEDGEELRNAFDFSEKVEMPWGLKIHTFESDGSDLSDPPPRAEPVEGIEGLSMTWHGRVYFEAEDEAWRILYTFRGEPVVVERRIGKGSLLLIADAYPFSNEALLTERNTALLRFAVGHHDRVRFHEHHLMIAENRGVALLMRRYRLQGLVLSLLILVGLYLWREGVSWMPPQDNERGGLRPVEGKDAQTGFINLLKRNQGSRRILRVCVDEWERSADLHGGARGDRMGLVRDVLDQEGPRGAQPSPVAMYNRICEITQKRK